MIAMETQAITARLPRDLHEWLRDAAHERRVSMNDVLVQALEAERKRQGGP